MRSTATRCLRWAQMMRNVNTRTTAAAATCHALRSSLPAAAGRLSAGSWARTGAVLLSVAAGLTLGGASAALAAAQTCDELSFIMVKPDGVQRGLIAEIIGRFERKGYQLVGIKVLIPSKELASKHYAEHDGKPFFPKLVDFLSSGAVVAMVWQGKDVIKYGRTMIGATNPLASAPGTIRGDFGIDVGRNIIHGSDSVESAQREITLWFRAEELAEWTPSLKSWVYE